MNKQGKNVIKRIQGRGTRRRILWVHAQGCKKATRQRKEVAEGLRSLRIKKEKRRQR